jgi:hypothetical protein
MKTNWQRRFHGARFVSVATMFFSLFLGLGTFVEAQQTAPSTVKASAEINPDQGKMGIYRSLAELAYQAYANQDDHTAAVLGRILERCWDKGEGDLRKSSPDTWAQIDQSMDGFIKPLTGFARNGRADEAKERAAYEVYLKALASAD